MEKEMEVSIYSWNTAIVLIGGVILIDKNIWGLALILTSVLNMSMFCTYNKMRKK